RIAAEHAERRGCLVTMTREAHTHLLDIVQDIAMADADAATVAPRAAGIGEEFTKKVEKRQIAFRALNILEPDRRYVAVALRTQSVAMGIGAAADINHVEITAAADLPVLIAPLEADWVRATVRRSLRLANQCGAGGNEFRQRLHDSRFDQPHSADRPLPYGCRERGGHDRARPRDHLEWPEHALVPRHVEGKDRQHRRPHASKEARFRAIHKARRLV